MTKNKRILLISQEIAPYLPANPISNLGKNLAQHMQKKGYEVRTFMPKYGNVNERRNQLHEVIRLSGVNIVIEDNDHPLIIKVASMQPSRIQVYFIDSDDYFQKDNSDVDSSGSNRKDNDERLIFFTRGTLETARKLKWDPEVILSSGWFTALIPLYLKKIFNDDSSFKNAQIVYQILPEKLNAPLDEKFFEKLKEDGVPAKDIKQFAEYARDTDLLNRMAIDFSQAIIVNDPDASPELIEYIKESGKPWLPYEKVSEGLDSISEFVQNLSI